MTTITKMLKSFALATAALSLPAAAAHAETFKRDGVTYEYTSTTQNGRTIITGTADRVPFRFVVHGRFVTGTYNYQPVDFFVPTTKQARGQATVAVR